MKHPIIGLLRRTRGVWVLMAATAPVGAQTPSPAPAEPPAPVAAEAPAAASPDQTSYLFGLTFGEQMHRVGIGNDLVMEALTRGLKDGLQGKATTPAEQQQLNEYVRSTIEAAVARNKAAAKEFLARNARDKGVKTTASGLEYKVIEAGNRKAAPIAPTDEVTVQYRGKLLDGTEFDSTYARGVPATFPVNRVIKGWQEALVLMKPGAKWQLFVPPELAYDATPHPGIPGGSLLIFDVDLLSVKPGAPPAGPPAHLDTNPNPK